MSEPIAKVPPLSSLKAVGGGPSTGSCSCGAVDVEPGAVVSAAALVLVLDDDDEMEPIVVDEVACSRGDGALPS
jgi:hypothetical protein